MRKWISFALTAAMALVLAHESWAGDNTPGNLVVQPGSAAPGAASQEAPYKVYAKEDLAVVARIGAEEVLKLQKQGVPVTIIDLRSPTSYAGSTIKIKGDVRIVYTELGNKLSLLPFDKRTLIVTYCT
ncbi:MAG: rhodanese-like domain-containing protein [Deltaproteobacteria bacterium]|nr:rhodanese-like domain-containing protein [Deltaproteobacteria bacterium]